MAEIPHLRLSLSNRPENVLVVRQALTGVAECLALDPIETNDLNTAVTEACNNVVAHAYRGAEGPLEVDVYARTDALAVVVRDRGRGIALPVSHAGGDEPGGMGLLVIDALSRRVEFAQPANGGTEVRMEFGAAKAAPEPLAAADARLAPSAHATAPAGTASSAVELSVAPNAMARAVLPRVLSTLAARAHFSTDRISDVQIVADVLAANAGDSISASRLDVGVKIATRNLDLRIGPLHAGRGETLVTAAADGLAPVIERLTDERHRIARADGAAAEILELRLVDQRR